MIKINNISKTYNAGKTNSVAALKNVSFKIDNGEMVAVVGPSGAGKSTLLNILNGSLSFDQGEYFFQNKNVADFKDKELANFRNRQVGMVYQNYMLLEENTALENIEIPLLFANVKKKTRIELCEKALKDTGASAFKNSRVKNLSGGQKQRVSIARALVNNPYVILADEPTGALDSNGKSEILELLHKINLKGKTILIVTHDSDVVNACNRVIHLCDGSVV